MFIAYIPVIVYELPFADDTSTTPATTPVIPGDSATKTGEAIAQYDFPASNDGDLAFQVSMTPYTIILSHVTASWGKVLDLCFQLLDG